jgi:hypothetical protein
MANSSKKQQPAKNHKPSLWGHVEQVPESDAVIPQTQLKSANSDPDFDVNLSAHDLAVLERTQVKRQADTTMSLQPSTFPLLIQTFRLEKPSSAAATTTSPFNFLPTPRAADKNAPKEDSLAFRPSVHPDTVVSSTKNTGSEALKQGMDTLASSALMLMTSQLSAPGLHHHSLVYLLRSTSMLQSRLSKETNSKLSTISFRYHHA